MSVLVDFLLREFLRMAKKFIHMLLSLEEIQVESSHTLKTNTLRILDE